MAVSEVDEFLEGLDHPLLSVLGSVREVILAADQRIEECIKWKSPTFTYEGNLASINPRAKKHISLMFHTGAKIPGDFPSLSGSGETARYLTFADESEVQAKRAELERIVHAWCAMKDAS